jgi:cell envelope opacity-associated protein A
MGRIAPRRRNTTRIYQPLLRTWLNFSERLKPGSTPDSTELPETPVEEPQPPKKDKRQGIKAALLKIWHLPDDFDWMEPLPRFHRRWVIIFGAILLLALLWPYSDDSRQPSATAQDNGVPLQAQWQDNASTQPQSGNGQHYQIQPGQTLAQLFRDNNMPVNEVFAMAQEEGSDKPLSNLKAGQEVRIERSANGTISALSVITANGNQVTFSRQADGSYRRAP